MRGVILFGETPTTIYSISQFLVHAFFCMLTLRCANFDGTKSMEFWVSLTPLSILQVVFTFPVSSLTDRQVTIRSKNFFFIFQDAVLVEGLHGLRNCVSLLEKDHFEHFVDVLLVRTSISVILERVDWLLCQCCWDRRKVSVCLTS